MKVTVDLPDWVVTALLAWNVPEELAGASIEERLCFLAEDSASGILSSIEQTKSFTLYRLLGQRHPNDLDDDIPL